MRFTCAFLLKFARCLLWKIFDVIPQDQKWVMGRSFASCPCVTNGDLLLFLPILFWIAILKHFLELFSMLSIVTELLLVTVEILWGQFLSLTYSSSYGDWYKGTIWLMNYCILLCTMIPTTTLLKSAVPDVGWSLGKSSSYWVMYGKKFVYVLYKYGVLRQVLSVSLKSTDVHTLL